MTNSNAPVSELSKPSLVRAGALTLVLAAALSACGGGSDADTPATEVPATVTASTSAEALGETAPVFVATATMVTAATEQAQAVVAGSNCALANFQAELMQRINAWRAKGASCGSYGTFAPTTALAWNNLLQSAAARHSKDMAGKNFFSHTGSDGSSAGTRITQAGYTWSTWGENIAAGQATVQAVVDGWMASPGHCANLMKPAFRHVGVACVSNSTSTYKKYWTMDLAAPR